MIDRNERRLQSEPDAKSASNALRNDLTPSGTQQQHRSFMITSIKLARSASAEANIESSLFDESIGDIRKRTKGHVSKDVTLFHPNHNAARRELEMLAGYFRPSRNAEPALHSTGDPPLPAVALPRCSILHHPLKAGWSRLRLDPIRSALHRLNLPPT